MGKYAVLSVLPNKIARFLYEYHDTSYHSSLGLPAIPLDRSSISVYGILKPEQVPDRPYPTKIIYVSPRGHSCRGNCSGPIARTMCLFARLGSLIALFSSGWITFGSQTSPPIQNLYKERRWHAVSRMRLRLCAGRVQGPAESKSYSAFFTYAAYCDMFLDLSLGRSVSICYPQRAP